MVTTHSAILQSGNSLCSARMHLVALHLCSKRYGSCLSATLWVQGQPHTSKAVSCSQLPYGRDYLGLNTPGFYTMHALAADKNHGLLCAEKSLMLQGFLVVLAVYFAALSAVMINVFRSSMAVTAECIKVRLLLS